MISFMISVVPVRTKAPSQILEIKLSERLALAPAGQDQQGLPGFTARGLYLRVSGRAAWARTSARASQAGSAARHRVQGA